MANVWQVYGKCMTSVGKCTTNIWQLIYMYIYGDCLLNVLQMYCIDKCSASV